MNKESHRKSVKKYDEVNTRFIGLKFNIKTDADILQRLEDMRGAGVAYQQYIKQCIRDDIPTEQ